MVARCLEALGHQRGGKQSVAQEGRAPRPQRTRSGIAVTALSRSGRLSVTTATPFGRFSIRIAR